MSIRPEAVYETADSVTRAVVKGEIDANIAAFILGFAPGGYVATISAVNGSGSGRSAPSAFER